MRFGLGLSPTIVLSPTSMAMWMIGGLMCGLTAMILMVRRQPMLPSAGSPAAVERSRALALHGSGLLLYSGIPLANFLLCFWLWRRFRQQSPWLNQQGIQALNFQISIYLYLLLSAFMVFAVLGVITTPLLLLLHLVCTLLACLQILRGRSFNYPANIPIIEGRPTRA
ncbi:MAG: DUF4870 domain-containing protein [Gammaproteobacteria bacterium]|nr:DUF4870 domain-containing protein [Gammaproteobacteria bacterium]